MEDFLDALDEEFVINESELKIKLDSCLIDVNEEIPPPEIAWEAMVASSGEYTIIGTLGNFSLVKGKAKSKKSFFISMAVSSAIGDGIIHDVMRSPMMPGKDVVLYFDTEQSKYHVQKAIKRICKQVNVPTPKNLLTYHLRKENPLERLKMIEYAIQNTPNIGFIVIDGIRDLITSINDESEATNIATKLLNWTESYNIHILTVLHENPTGDKARGHLGTELTNKAETIITVEVDCEDKDVSIVKPASCRNKPFDPFAFKINEEGIPEVIKDFSSKAIGSKKTPLNEIDEQQMINIFDTVLPVNTFAFHGELTNLIQSYLKDVNRNYSKCGVNNIKEFIKRALDKEIIKQDKIRGPYYINSIKVRNS